jgi:hypothetical protein
MAKYHSKDIASLTTEVEHREYFFNNHLSKTLMNVHQVEYIYVIESMHDEIIFEFIVERSVNEASRRIFATHNLQRDRFLWSILLWFDDNN